MSYDSSAVLAASRNYELARSFLRVPPYKTISSLKNYLLKKLKFSGEVKGNIHVTISGAFNNKVRLKELIPGFVNVNVNVNVKMQRYEVICKEVEVKKSEVK